jgi:hypothetical protein
MSKINTTKSQKKQEAIDRRNLFGYKVHGLQTSSPDYENTGLVERTNTVNRNNGKITEDNRILGTRRLDRSRLHFDDNPDNVANVSRGRKLLVAATVLGTLAAGAVGIGRIAPEGGEVPSPGNMEQFDNDSLQGKYSNNSENLVIKGGEIQYRTGPQDNVVSNNLNAFTRGDITITKGTLPPDTTATVPSLMGSPTTNNG